MDDNERRWQWVHRRSGNARCAVKHSLLYSNALAMRPQTNSDPEATNTVVKVTTSVKLSTASQAYEAIVFLSPA
jgi:hypothetical protein